MLIVPVRRYAAARRVLDIANVVATSRAAPTAAEIDERNREQILNAATATPPPDETEDAFVAELLSRLSPAQLAAAYLRQQIATRPVPEDISAVAVPSQTTSGRDREKPAAGLRDTSPRERMDMTGSAWFSLSVGRNSRADPKWILPLICKAGGVTRNDVGSIKIFDDETRFEISAAKSDAYAEKIARDGSGEKGVTITRSERRQQEPSAELPAWKGADTAKFKIRTDKGKKFEDKAAAPRSGRGEKPSPAKAPWSKDKPKYKPKDKGGMNAKAATSRKQKPKPHRGQGT